jgi:hypothetical protein
LKSGNTVRSVFTLRTDGILFLPLNELRGNGISKAGDEFKSKMPDKTLRPNEFHFKETLFPCKLLFASWRGSEAWTSQ